ncbi:intracellular coagulation inhibitor 3-like [Dermacentor silvarum]|uniref:intracellular coagulation inhibitor 3-like n=1 Tax=Dermacentor silvarum TaxID=543639 RepID=UPI00189B68E6|nr:intracellular coagulation inhibitor 3-like [Dermacentor silvarum]XP_049521528.1 intracellular coagulation inhibitor 3-like [Dermacentor silvarum]
MLAKFVLLVSVLAVAHCETDDNTLLARAHNQFGANLLKYLAAQEPSSNIFFSPTSIAAAFGMAYVGARGNSEAELDSVFGHTALGLTGRDRVLAAYKNLLELSTSPNVTLDVANMVLALVGFPISDSYKQQLREIFDADARSADFHEDGPRVAAEVNAWVRGKTRGKISGILPEGQPLDIVLLILNAVCFKGAWVTIFDTHKTVNKPFLNLGTTEVSKPAMHLRTRLPHTRVNAYHASAVEIPYQGDRFSMVVLLPDDPTGLATVRDGLSLDLLEDVGSKLSFRDVMLQLPKFEISLRYELVPAMKALGLNSVFGGSANFSGISESVRVFISDAVHKVAVEVNEGGTIATTVTAVLFETLSAYYDSLPPIEFIVNHPFLYYIRDRSTNRVLFIGVVHTL